MWEDHKTLFHGFTWRRAVRSPPMHGVLLKMIAESLILMYVCNDAM